MRVSDLSPDLIGAYTGCLIPSDGDLFRVIGRDKLNITRGLKSVVGVSEQSFSCIIIIMQDSFCIILEGTERFNCK